MKKQYLIKRLSLVALCMCVCLCLFVPSSFAIEKEEMIKKYEEIIQQCKRTNAELRAMGGNGNHARIIESCNKTIASFQAKIDKLRSTELPGEKAYRADCGKVDPNRTTPITTDLCPGHLVAMTNFCGGGTGCPYVCCPKGFPYLNHCDCKCYTTSNFECHSYSHCKEQPKQ